MTFFHNFETILYRNKVIIIIETARPGLIIGRGGNGIELLKESLEKYIIRKKRNSLKPAEKAKRQIKIEIREIKNPFESASLVAQMASQQIEKRVPFRQVLKKSIERVMQDKTIKGIRIEVSGRLNGIEIARREWLAQGRLPRNTIRANIDYGFAEAKCTYGKIGVKVWLYKGDKFE